MKKKPKTNLKCRGIRFPDATWEKLLNEAGKQSSTPSELVRAIIEQYHCSADKIIIAAVKD